jgi:hypothetical protein
VTGSREANRISPACCTAVVRRIAPTSVCDRSASRIRASGWPSPPRSHRAAEQSADLIAVRPRPGGRYSCAAWSHGVYRRKSAFGGPAVLGRTHTARPPSCQPPPDRRSRRAGTAGHP